MRTARTIADVSASLFAYRELLRENLDRYWQAHSFMQGVLDAMQILPLHMLKRHVIVFANYSSRLLLLAMIRFSISLPYWSLIFITDRLTSFELSVSNPSSTANNQINTHTSKKHIISLLAVAPDNACLWLWLRIGIMR